MADSAPVPAKPAVPETTKIELLADRSLPGLSMDEKSCRSCAFYAFADGASRAHAANGECRRCAPAPGLSARAQWPVVEWNQWCGEWVHGVSHEEMLQLSLDLSQSIQAQNLF